MPHRPGFLSVAPGILYEIADRPHPGRRRCARSGRRSMCSIRKAYFTGKARLSKRHRVATICPGTGRFCPIIRRTEALTEFMALDLAASGAGNDRPHGRSPGGARREFHAARRQPGQLRDRGRAATAQPAGAMGRAILQAGKNRLTLEEIIRLQRVLIEDTRFVRAGLRPDGVFLGRTGSSWRSAAGIHRRAPRWTWRISWRACSKPTTACARTGSTPVLQAAATAFGFVYIHPFQDGNGRMHRCLIHHVLAERRIHTARNGIPSFFGDARPHRRLPNNARRSHSAPLMPFIEWRPTPERNVEVLNDTADLYRYFDCTAAGGISLRLRPAHGRARPAARDRLSAPARRSDAPHHGCGRDARPSGRKPGDVHSAEQGSLPGTGGRRIQQTARRRSRLDRRHCQRGVRRLLIPKQS